MNTPSTAMSVVTAWVRAAHRGALRPEFSAFDSGEADGRRLDGLAVLRL